MTLNRGYAYRTQVQAGAAGRTLCAHLALAHTHSDAATWQARCDAGEVTLDGAVAQGGEVLRAGQDVVWHRPPWDEPDVPTDIVVVHEDDAVLAVTKPSGLPTAPAGGFLDHTLLAMVQARFGAAHPVHRLGRFTSGLVLFARDAHAAAALGRAWQEHDVRKDYRALVTGSPPWTTQEITLPIGPVPHPRLGSVHAASATGRAAHSVATVVERRGETTLLEVRITTGRPHQIRIHLAAAGHPLTGDPLYAVGGGPRRDHPGLPGDGGYLLHAHRLQVAHPRGGTLRLEAPLPGMLTARRA